MSEPATATAGKALGLLRAVSSNSRTHKELVESLWEFGQMGPAAVPELLKAFADPSEAPYTRHWAMYLVERNGGLELGGTREVLITAMADPSPDVRRTALASLGALGDPSLVPFISSFLGDQGTDNAAWFEDDRTVSHAAAAALRKIGTSEALEALEQKGGAGA